MTIAHRGLKAKDISKGQGLWLSSGLAWMVTQSV